MTPRHWLLLAILLLPGAVTSVPARADDPPVTQDRAMAMLRDGKRQEALHALEAILAARPADPSQALFAAGMIDMEDGNWKTAKPLLERLVVLRPAFYPGWELMVQAYQAAGQIEKRDAAIESLYTAWHSAMDPAIQSRVSFARDRIVGPKRTLLAQETLEPGGDDILRFLFQPTDELGKPRHLILVRSDNDTNERWREDGTVPYGTVVYHLDTVEQLPNGRSLVRPYKYFLDSPSYDDVRPLVLQILAGTVQPLTGTADPFWTGDPAK